MTLDDLRERIKNELVLHEGNIADWQWNRTGLPAEAAELGIADFLRLVDDVARSLNAQFGKILDLQAVIKKVATDSQNRLSAVQIGGFALEAERLGLSKAFVTEQWVPRIVAQLPTTTNVADATEAMPPTTAAPERSEPSGTLANAPTNVPTPETAASMRQKVRDSLDDYKEYIPAQAIRTLFRTISYDQNALAEAILTYLRDSFYASETEPVGPTLRDKLTSTNWQHLVWWDRQPATTQPPSLPPAAPSGTLPPASAALAGASSSAAGRDLLLALLIAGGLIGFVIFMIKSGQSDTSEDTAVGSAQVDSSYREAEPSVSVKPRRKKKRRTEQADSEITTQREATEQPLRKRPYDELGSDVGQYGERPARKGELWGLWKRNYWLISPEYDAVEVFRDGRARVSINGNSYEIDKNGNRVRE
jgi:hypothetical protein